MNETTSRADVPNALIAGQTILPVETQRRERLVLAPCTVSKPLSLRGLR